MNYKELLEIAKNSNNIYITGHINPDGDCIGAVLAMTILLKNEGIEAKGILEEVSKVYDYLPTNEYIIKETDEEIDLLISLDCGDEGRISQSIKKYNTLINIDHHASNTFFGQYNIVEEKASSTCEIIFKLIRENTKLTKEIAASLYTGIVYDTGGFKHSNTSQDTHMVAGELIKYGFDFTDIINRLFYYKSVDTLKAHSIAIDNLKLFYNDKVSTSYLTLEEMNSIGVSKNNIEGIVQMLNEINGTECAVFIYETEVNNYKVSLRSKGKVDVCKIAKHFNGGGHIKASGCTVKGDSSTIIQKILEEIYKQLNAS